MQKTVFKIHGLDCAEEVAVLKRELGPLVGGEEQLAFDILNGKLFVLSSEASQILPESVIRTVSRTGMRAELWEDGTHARRDASFLKKHGRTLATVACGLCGLAGFLTHAWSSGEVTSAVGWEEAGHQAPLISILLYILGILSGMWLTLPRAWHAVLAVRPDMNLLMLVAVIGAAAIGEWLEAVTVAFLFSVSLLLESWSVGRARRAIGALMDLAPHTARVRRTDGSEIEVAAKDVEVGSIFIVRPSAKIPLDGRVLRGFSDVNQAPITGESVPVQKLEGSEVFAGTINGDGRLEVECTKPATDTTLAHIVRMVGEAQSRRAPSEKWVEKFARIYTPLVLAIAVIVLIIPPLVFNGSWSEWLYRSLVLLVIACPCALVISTPVSVVASLAAAAHHGVLIKGGLYVELPAQLKAIAFDKTGTLTAGNPSVIDVVPLSGHDDVELLQRAAALEAHSNHPLARAIVEATMERKVQIPHAEDFEITPGKGATGRIGGKQYWLGSHRYLEERGQETPQVHEQLQAMQTAGRTVVVIGDDRHVCGFITLSDALRPSATPTLKQIRAAGVQHLVMLTGDNEGTARAITAEAGLDEYHAELLPAEKVKVIDSLVEKYGQVAMVGDGVNDAPALGRASLGIAMGAAGSDAAIETADIALMSDDLSKLPWLIQHSRRTLAIIRQNIAFSLAVKVLFVILAFAGFTSLWAAIAADTGASLLVIFNGLRLLYDE